MNIVKLYIYEVTKGQAQIFSNLLLGTTIEGIWHTSIVVFGMEYYFGRGGIQSCIPGTTQLSQPDEIIDLGHTEVDVSLFKDYLESLNAANFSGSEYHLFHHNCNTFSNELAIFLTGQSIPPYIIELPNKVLSCPFGPVINAYLESFDLQISSPSSSNYLQSSTTSAPSIQTPPRTPEESTDSSFSKMSDSTKATPADLTQFKGKSGKTSSKNEDNLPPPIESFQDENKPDLFVGIEALELFNKMKERFKNKISESELQLLTECYTYITTDEPLWCINDHHAQFLFKILHDDKTFDKEDKILVLQMLQQLVLSFDFVLVAKHECTHGLMGYIQNFDKLSMEERVAILALLSNCCYTKTGFYYLTSMIEWPENSLTTYNNGTVVAKIISDSLLMQYDKPELFKMATNLVWHLAAHKVPEEMAVEMSIALLQALKSEKDEKLIYGCLVALNSFLDITPEVQSLFKVMDMSMDMFANVSARIDTICKDIAAKVDRPLPNNYGDPNRSGSEVSSSASPVRPA